MALGSSEMGRPLIALVVSPRLRFGLVCAAEYATCASPSCYPQSEPILMGTGDESNVMTVSWCWLLECGLTCSLRLMLLVRRLTLLGPLFGCISPARLNIGRSLDFLEYGFDAARCGVERQFLLRLYGASCNRAYSFDRRCIGSCLDVVM